MLVAFNGMEARTRVSMSMIHVRAACGHDRQTENPPSTLSHHSCMPAQGQQEVRFVRK